MRVADLDKLLEALDQANRRYEETEAAHTKSHREVVDAALAALRAGAEPGDVYARIPFTSTYMRALARDAGIPAGRPGIKTRPKDVRIPMERPKRHAAHGDTSSPT